MATANNDLANAMLAQAHDNALAAGNTDYAAGIIAAAHIFKISNEPGALLTPQTATKSALPAPSKTLRVSAYLPKKKKRRLVVSERMLAACRINIEKARAVHMAKAAARRLLREGA